MKDRVKNAFKRVSSGFMAVLLVVCLVGTPRAKAVVSEGALLGSAFGSLLVSMGFSWAADNFDSPSFGEAIYDLIKQCDEEINTGIQLLLDANLAGLTAVGNGKLTFSQQWVKLANSFANWFQEKFFTGGNTSATVIERGAYFTLADGTPFYFRGYDGTSLSSSPGSKLSFLDKPVGSKIYLSNGSYFVYQEHPSAPQYHGIAFVSGSSSSYLINGEEVSFFINDSEVPAYVGMCSTTSSTIYDKRVFPLSYLGEITNASNLSAEKPAEVHYPAVAEDGSQVYEITVDGVTATDIEGIIQGAVDRILAGTAAIVGSVEQAGTAGEVVNPEIDPYKVSLTTVFPFCIPFDVYNMVTMFVAEPEAPNAEWTFTLPWSNQEYSVGWDLAAFDGVARICRDMQLVLFAVGLAVITYKVIKW